MSNIQNLDKMVTIKKNSIVNFNISQFQDLLKGSDLSSIYSNKIASDQKYVYIYFDRDLTDNEMTTLNTLISSYVFNPELVKDI